MEKKKLSSIFLAKMNSVTESVPSWQINRITFAVATKSLMEHKQLVICYYEYPFAFLGMNVNLFNYEWSFPMDLTKKKTKKTQYKS